MAMERNQYLGTPEFNSNATGAKQYGLGRGAAATSGSVSKDGYVERDQRARARRRAIQNRLQMASQPGTITPEPGGY